MVEYRSYVGLDVHKETIAVADPVFQGEIRNRHSSPRRITGACLVLLLRGPAPPRQEAGRLLDLLTRFIHQDAVTRSRHRQEREFAELTDDEVARIEADYRRVRRRPSLNANKKSIRDGE